MKINKKPETLVTVHTHTILIKNKKWNQQKRNKE